MKELLFDLFIMAMIFFAAIWFTLTFLER